MRACNRRDAMETIEVQPMSDHDLYLLAEDAYNTYLFAKDLEGDAPEWHDLSEDEQANWKRASLRYLAPGYKK